MFKWAIPGLLREQRAYESAFERQRRQEEDEVRERERARLKAAEEERAREKAREREREDAKRKAAEEERKKAYEDQINKYNKVNEITRKMQEQVASQVMSRIENMVKIRHYQQPYAYYQQQQPNPQLYQQQPYTNQQQPYTYQQQPPQP